MEKKTKKTKKDPIQLLLDYMEQQGLRLVDFFNKLDTDGGMSLSRIVWFHLKVFKNFGFSKKLTKDKNSMMVF